jgi:YidC/Oxa1 family membrane protein insertase
VRWAAAGDKFFTIAAVPFPERPPRERGCKQHALDASRAEVALSFATRSVAPGEKTEYPFIVFAGPKHTNELEAIRPGGEDAKLADVVDVTFAVLSRPMLALLKQFYRLTGNWGIAIILLTIVVRLVTFYPTHRTLVSAKKMQGLSDKIAALRKKYENDKQKLGVETMNLYKAHGVNPLGGCLPSLIQMPIWIALFSTLNYSVELYHSSFFWYITDLSAKDPYYLAPLLMGSVMFIQMRMSPAGTDPQQQKMMAVMMPVMFTGFSLFLPAGLSIYTLTSYLIGILQQVYVNRKYRLRPRGPAVPAKA